MLLKKQTVWLLTMLSLVIVLSVYYITSPTQQATDMAYQEKDAKENQDVEEIVEQVLKQVPQNEMNPEKITEMVNQVIKQYQLH